MTGVWREGWWLSSLEVLRAVLLCLQQFAVSLYDLPENLSTCTWLTQKVPPRLHWRGGKGDAEKTRAGCCSLVWEKAATPGRKESQRSFRVPCYNDMLSNDSVFSMMPVTNFWRPCLLLEEPNHTSLIVGGSCTTGTYLSYTKTCKILNCLSVPLFCIVLFCFNVFDF